MIGITSVFVICKRVKTIAVTIQFCDESGLAILNYASTCMNNVLLAHVLRQILLQLVCKGTGHNEKTK